MLYKYFASARIIVYKHKNITLYNLPVGLLLIFKTYIWTRGPLDFKA